MKKELKDIFKEIMNLGMTLRQHQLSGWSGESGNDVLENYLKENEQRIFKTLENDFGEELKVGDKVCFTSDCQDEFDIEEGSVGIIFEIFDFENLYHVRIEGDYEEDFEQILKRDYLIKL